MLWFEICADIGLVLIANIFDSNFIAGGHNPEMTDPLPSFELL